jgi:hypothetical protein
MRINGVERQMAIVTRNAMNWPAHKLQEAKDIFRQTATLDKEGESNMPYIKEDARVALGHERGRLPENAGELNYALTQVVLTYLGKDFNYQRINDAVGALECCKLELYRRLAAPYEDVKIKENGDIYE